MHWARFLPTRSSNIFCRSLMFLACHEFRKCERIWLLEICIPQEQDIFTFFFFMYLVFVIFVILSLSCIFLFSSLFFFFCLCFHCIYNSCMSLSVSGVPSIHTIKNQGHGTQRTTHKNTRTHKH